MPQTRYRTFAGYNRWANLRLYEFASHLSPDQYKADRGAFFHSVHGTLNHLLVADRIWMRRFTGTGDASPRLDTILFNEFAALSAAREAEDERIGDFIEHLDEGALAGEVHTSTAPATPSRSGWTACSTISSITRPIIAGRPTPFSPIFSAMAARLRSTSSPSSAR